MPFLERPCGARIYYEVKGCGIPVLLIAGGGMRSSIPFWENQPWNPWRTLPTSQFCLIAMDQRSAQVGGGQSSCRFQSGDSWHTFVQDQLALLDFLGIDRCISLGQCIGPSYQLRLLKEAPERFLGAVLLQPIGLTIHTTETKHLWSGLNYEAASHWFGSWSLEMEKANLASPSELRELYDSMYGNGKDFVFSITREELQCIKVPLLVLMGVDIYHPAEIAREIVRLAPQAELVEQWRDAGQDTLAAAIAKVQSFLLRYGERMALQKGLAKQDTCSCFPCYSTCLGILNGSFP
eukprot:TRINITY_DN7654_c0_g2_i2.p1 TRINITY_DN7654_c0_g2~~TRINITY_DN7654_c0_g2_i2.p1  ORF type:complete len:293 (-),score=34.05 TRINITY_DN7654_c0_g2_i2:1262-2140(-)